MYRNMSGKMENHADTDEILGIQRCARCGHRLDNEIECPLCSDYYASAGREAISTWVYFTACFITSPVSIYFIFRNNRLGAAQKILALSGCLFWFGLYSFL